MPPSGVLLNLQLRVITALPVEDEHDVSFLEAYDDLMENRPNNSLARRGRRCRMRPRQFQVGAQLHKAFSFRLAHNSLLLGLDHLQLIFEVAHRHERLVPAVFEFACDQAIVGIHRLVLAPCMTGLVAGLLKRQLHLSAFFCDFGGLGSNDIQRRFHAKRFEQPQDLRAYCLIDAQAAEGDASVATMVDVSALAVIATGFAVEPP